MYPICSIIYYYSSIFSIYSVVVVPSRTKINSKHLRAVTLFLDEEIIKVTTKEKRIKTEKKTKTCRLVAFLALCYYYYFTKYSYNTGHDYIVACLSLSLSLSHTLLHSPYILRYYVYFLNVSTIR